MQTVRVYFHIPHGNALQNKYFGSVAKVWERGRRGSGKGGMGIVAGGG